MSTALAIFARRGYAATRLADVADAMGVTRGAIYGHFASKQELFLAVVRKSQDPIYALLAEVEREAAAGVSPRASLRGMMLGWCRLLREDPQHRAGFELVMTKTTFVDELEELYEREKQLTRDVIRTVTRTVERGQAVGEFPAGLNPRDAGLTVYLHLMGLTQAWLFNPALFSLARRAETLADATLGGLGVQTA
ncbi:TetR family transcriptional regulator [Phycisphaera mikurensis]|uniref:TetR family transcriptional regulator n=1 Tax=Phycisphaera mikurensis (strain NBRC 102666 / KCTC 22515 / FYK2301M01) TaxID=1142394 RepID=I0IE03_PHYMF|nr:TetR family transcriptional regulator [Phycisphaera mikurensis]MBB6441298.1 TetR/AcrR family acrAB operon transcriptional repressor [Phycisphaera mikurensis]BAM03491.1 TetR family transcriptional regulator [Phycisphaera mikurensis NBRC 102666]